MNKKSDNKGEQASNNALDFSHAGSLPPAQDHTRVAIRAYPNSLLRKTGADKKESHTQKVKRAKK